MAEVYLGLGTNLGDKEANLDMAMEEIRKRVGETLSLSAYYITEPWGFDSQNTFLNAVCKVSTHLGEIFRKVPSIRLQTLAISRSSPSHICGSEVIKP